MDVKNAVNKILESGYTPEQIAVSTESSSRSVYRWAAGVTIPKKSVQKKIKKILDRCPTA